MVILPKSNSEILVQIFQGQLLNQLIEHILDWQVRFKTEVNAIAALDPATQKLLELIEDRQPNATTEFSAKLKNWITENPNPSFISPELKSIIRHDQLKNLQVEGDLIEARLPECDALWLILKRFNVV